MSRPAPICFLAIVAEVATLAPTLSGPRLDALALSSRLGADGRGAPWPPRFTRK